MNIYNYIGKEIDNPIRSNNDLGDIRNLWHKVQKQRVKNLTLRSPDIASMRYTLLYYVPGLTTFCGIRGIPVITGFMSGCYLFRYRSKGELRAAHIGTHDTKKEFSDKAKDAWKSLVEKPHITEVWGFDPLKDVSQRLLQKAMAKIKIGTPKIIGIWDSNGSSRIGVVLEHHNDPFKVFLVGIEYAPLRPWSSIKDDPKMQ
jgi:hypothetical protein